MAPVLDSEAHLNRTIPRDLVYRHVLIRKRFCFGMPPKYNQILSLSSYSGVVTKTIQGHCRHNDKSFQHSPWRCCIPACIPLLSYLPHILKTQRCAGAILGKIHKPAANFVGENWTLTRHLSKYSWWVSWICSSWTKHGVDFRPCRHSGCVPHEGGLSKGGYLPVKLIYPVENLWATYLAFEGILQPVLPSTDAGIVRALHC